jgi:hypothetical protein
MKHATVLLASVLVLLAVCVPGWAAYGDVDCPTGTPPADTGTPYLQTQYPTATPWDTATPWPTATWVTPTSPPEWTTTVEFAPDPSPSATVTPRSPDGEDEPQPTWDCYDNYDERHCLAQTGGGGLPLLPTFFLGFAFFAVAFITGMIRRTR